MRAGAERGDEQFPHAAVATLHGVADLIPTVEVTDDGDGLGVGGPDGEADALHVAFAHAVGSQHAVTFVMGAFGMEVQLEGCQGRSDGGCLHTAIMALDAAAS